MPKKYHITTSPAPPRLHPVGKYSTVEFREECAGSCRQCVKKKCVYNIFADNYFHMSQMDEPEYLYTCNSCFRCVQECTRGIFSRVINPEYRTMGDAFWTANIINRTWYQAHTGAVPVSGAGYRGPFSGEGFDSMWTDMSEIVRPTRDGIHGREYINTTIELSRRPQGLHFNSDGTLATEVVPILESPIPIVFRMPESYGVNSEGTLLSIVKAASKLGAFMIIKPEFITEELKPYLDNLIPQLVSSHISKYEILIKKCRMVEIQWDADILDSVKKIKGVNPDIYISVAAVLDGEAAKKAVGLSGAGIDTIHYQASHHGKEVGVENPRYLRDAIRDIHLALVENSARLKVNLLFSGGIAMAEHVVKAIICGADGVVIDSSLFLALECRLCYRCVDGLSCTAKLEEIDSEYGSKRIMNLMGAWRNQILEILGAMGLREVRRLRGEIGRSMWFENLEKENFGPIFGERKVP
jgi:ferredoxin